MNKNLIQKINDLKWIIVGFDPGLTIGIAIIDLNGNILYVKSIKEASHSKIINEIIKYGKVIVVSTDVTNPPKNVKKLAAILNSKIYSPPKSMSIDFKNNIVDEYIKKTNSQINITNSHERDSLAAAIKSYKHYEKKLNIVDKKCAPYKFTEKEIENIKNEVINGIPIVKSIKSRLNLKNTNPKKSTKSENITTDKKTLEYLEKQNNNLKKQLKIHKNQIIQIKKYNNKLKEKIKNQNIELKQIKIHINKIHEDYDNKILLNDKILSKIRLIEKLKKEIKEKDEENQKLKNKLNSNKEIKKIKTYDDTVVVKIIDSFTKEGLNKAINNWNLKKNDFIYIKNSKWAGTQTANTLSKIKPKTIIISDNMPTQALETLKHNNIPIINLKNIHLTFLNEFAITSLKEITAEIEKCELKIQNQKDNEEKEQILKVFDEYKAKRKREYK